MPSTRIAVLNMLPYLVEAGFDPYIVRRHDENSEQPRVEGVAESIRKSECDVVVFQKIHGPHVVQLANELRRCGIKTLYLVCDVIAPEMAATTDATAVVTDYLRSLYPNYLQDKIFTVHDGIERPEVEKTSWGTHTGSRERPLNAVLVTSAELDHIPVLESPPSWLRITVVGPYPPKSDLLQRLRCARWQYQALDNWSHRLRLLRFLAAPQIAREAWHPEQVYEYMLHSDIGILPIQTDKSQGATKTWHVKSENRLTMMMSVGLPVIATPIPSYLPIVEHGRNAYFANSKSEWLDALEDLRDPTRRQKVGMAARNSVIERYAMAKQAEKLIAVLRRLTG